MSLSEQALTTDLIDVINNEDIFPTFYLVMKSRTLRMKAAMPASHSRC
ncbi:hypothetical protein NFX37_06445 [Serratia marcescens]|nr:hypothetical protein NFX37_06445 [Serratia marcescens]